ncbi:hypothetical protein BU25DRAFT_387231, partial [Macroventuria anomochaeta]
MAANGSPERRRRSMGMYRRESNMSEAASFMEDVEMAQDEIFAGPGMSESVPTSVSAFSHRRRERADSSASLTSFAYYDEEQDSDQDFEEEAIAEVDDDEIDDGEVDDEVEYDGYTAEELEDMDRDLESGLRTEPSPLRRKSSGSR